MVLFDRLETVTVHQTQAVQSFVGHGRNRNLRDFLKHWEDRFDRIELGELIQGKGGRVESFRSLCFEW